MPRYSDQCRRDGELSAPEAARVLGVTSTTLCRWARDAIAGERSRLSVEGVRRDLVGRYWFNAVEISRLMENA